MKPVEFVDGCPVHRPWFKVFFNPVLRRWFGLEIVTIVEGVPYRPVRYVLRWCS